jgi:hypothetical protein
MKKISYSSVFLPLAAVLFLYTSYWIYKNVDFKDLIEKIGNSRNLNNGDGQFLRRNILIKNNNIVEILSVNEEEVIIEGSEIEGMESITDLSLSPDGRRFCFLVKTIVPVWLYVYDLENEELIKVDTAKNCHWSPDSKNIAYNNHTTDVSPIDIYIYNVSSGEKTNITKDFFGTDFIGQFCNISWKNEKEISAVGVKVDVLDIGREMEGKGYVIDIENRDNIYETAGNATCN